MSGGEVFQNIALLLLQRGHHRHHTLDKARTVLALRAKAPLTPLHPRTDRPLRRVIGWCDTLDLHERPQRLAPLQHLPAWPCGCGHTTYSPLPIGVPPPGEAGSYTTETSSVAGCPRAPDATTQTSGAPAPARRHQSPRSAHHGRAWLRHRGTHAPST